MFKKLLSVLLIMGVLFAFGLGEEANAAPKWWQIVKADAIGALEGYLGSGTLGGAVIGGALGSLAASIASGTSGGSWEVGATADASVGLHHNLALNYIYQNMEFKGKVLTDSEKIRVLELLNQYMVRNNLKAEDISDDYLSPDEVEKGLDLKLQNAVRNGRISAEFNLALKQAIELLDSGIDEPQAYLDKATPLLYERITGEEDRIIAEIFLDVLKYSSAYWKDAAMRDREKVLILTLEQGQAVVDGSNMTLDVSPYLRDGRTLVPFRFIGEQLGASIGWNASNRSVSYITADTEITLFIDSTTAIINGIKTTLDTPPILENGRTVVPVRFISEALGFSVDWIPGVRQIIITGRVTAQAGPINIK